jgi:hypothetical protein
MNMDNNVEGKYALYIRVGRADNSEADANLLHEQIRALMQYCLSKGWPEGRFTFQNCLQAQDEGRRAS